MFDSLTSTPASAQMRVGLAGMLVGVMALSALAWVYHHPAQIDPVQPSERVVLLGAHLLQSDTTPAAPLSCQDIAFFTNTSSRPTEMLKVTSSGPITPDGCGGCPGTILPAGGSCMVRGAPEALHAGVLHAVLRVTGVQPPIDVPVWGMATSLAAQAAWSTDPLVIHVDPAQPVVPWVARLTNKGTRTILHPDQHMMTTGDTAFSSESGSCTKPLLPGEGCTVHGLLKAIRGRQWEATLQSDAAPPLVLVGKSWTPDLQFVQNHVSVQAILDQPVVTAVDIQNLGPVEGLVHVQAPDGITAMMDACAKPLPPQGHCTLGLSVAPGAASGVVQLGDHGVQVDIVAIPD